MMSTAPILIVGQFREEHMGFHFKTAAETLQIPHETLNIETFKSSYEIFNKIAWRVFDKKMWHQKKFENCLLQQTEAQNIKTVIILGTSPINPLTLERLRENQIRTINFMTDDPWSPQHSSDWLWASLSRYDLVVTPRRSNLDQLKAMAPGNVIYLPFGYNPKVHFEESDITVEEQHKYDCDVMFFGGADNDRIPFVSKLIQEGFSVKLYGGYWDRYSETRPFTHGIVKLSEIRKAVKASKIVLNLVRRANRDGHVMRTYEVPAMGGCMLNERTEEHLEIFGEDNCLFFNSPEEMHSQVKLLVESKALRFKYAQLSQERIINGKNTYADRLQTILSTFSV